MPIKVQIIGGDELARLGNQVGRARDLLTKGILGAMKAFTLEAAGRSVKEYLTGPRPERLGRRAGRLASSVAESPRVDQKGDVISGSIGTNVVYGRIWEKGGEIRTRVTDKMRRFAWAKFYETGDPLYRGLALTRKNQLIRKVRAKPFLEPAVQDTIPSLTRDIRSLMERLIVSEGSNGK